MPSNIEHLKIYGHTEEPSSVDATSGDMFEALVNPENIQTKRSLIFNSDNRANTGHDVMQYQGYGHIEFNVKLLISNWKEVSREDKKVKDQIEELLKVTYDYKGSSHKAPYVTIHWGSHFKFIGHLKDMSIDYTIFNPDGECTHAVAELQFVNHVNTLQAALEQNRNSPDMTHMKVMRDGDKIPLICNDIYDDPHQYIQIAEINGLTNFRNVSVGKKIMFPPLVN